MVSLGKRRPLPYIVVLFGSSMILHVNKIRYYMARIFMVSLETKVGTVSKNNPALFSLKSLMYTNNSLTNNLCWRDKYLKAKFSCTQPPRHEIV
jgi:hypothetical protein